MLPVLEKTGTERPADPSRSGIDILLKTRNGILVFLKSRNPQKRDTEHRETENKETKKPRSQGIKKPRIPRPINIPTSNPAPDNPLKRTRVNLGDASGRGNLHHWSHQGKRTKHTNVSEQQATMAQKHEVCCDNFTIA